MGYGLAWWETETYGKEQVFGKLVIARSFDDDCWQVMVRDEDGEIYRPWPESGVICGMSLDNSVYTMNSSNAKKLRRYFQERWKVDIPIQWGIAHVERFWNYRFRKHGRVPV